MCLESQWSEARKKVVRSRFFFTECETGSLVLNWTELRSMWERTGDVRSSTAWQPTFDYGCMTGCVTSDDAEAADQPHGGDCWGWARAAGEGPPVRGAARGAGATAGPRDHRAAGRVPAGQCLLHPSHAFWHLVTSFPSLLPCFFPSSSQGCVHCSRLSLCRQMNIRRKLQCVL